MAPAHFGAVNQDQAFARSPLFTSRFAGGLTFEGYEKLIVALSLRPVESAHDEADRAHLQNARINLQRTTRIMKTHVVTEEQRAILKQIVIPQQWMVLSEAWCGDSAQSIPYIWNLAGCTPHITCRILLRDENPEIMDRYLTNGTRGIPKLVVFSSDGRELFRWGPRPQEAQEMFEAALAAGLTKAGALERLHLWYGRNKGEAIQREILHLVLLNLVQPVD